MSGLLGPVLRKPYRRDDLTRQIKGLLAGSEDAQTVRAVALEMVQRHADALERTNEAAELDRAKGDELSAHAWQDIAAAIAVLR